MVIGSCRRGVILEAEKLDFFYKEEKFFSSYKPDVVEELTSSGQKEG